MQGLALPCPHSAPASAPLLEKTKLKEAAILALVAQQPHVLFLSGASACAKEKKRVSRDYFGEATIKLIAASLGLSWAEISNTSALEIQGNLTEASPV